MSIQLNNLRRWGIDPSAGVIDLQNPISVNGNDEVEIFAYHQDTTRNTEHTIFPSDITGGFYTTVPNKGESAFFTINNDGTVTIHGQTPNIDDTSGSSGSGDLHIYQASTDQAAIYPGFADDEVVNVFGLYH